MSDSYYIYQNKNTFDVRLVLEKEPTPEPEKEWELKARTPHCTTKGEAEDWARWYIGGGKARESAGRVAGSDTTGDDPIRTPRLLLLAAICAVPESKTRPIGQVDVQAVVDAIWAHERLNLPITAELEIKALAYCYGKEVVVMGNRMEVAAGPWTSEQQGFVKAAWANLQALRALRPRW